LNSFIAIFFYFYIHFNSKCLSIFVAVGLYTGHEIGKFDTILCIPRAVNKLKGFIFVLCVNSNGDSKVTLRAYEDISPYDLLWITTTEEVIQPSEMGGIESPTTVIYVSDHACECIWKIDIDNNRVSRFLSYLDRYNRFSVTSDNHILLVRSFRYPNRLEIYDQQANLIREIPISNTFVGLLTAIQKPSGDFIVSHGLKKSTSFLGPKRELSIISLLSISGEIIEQFTLKGDHFYDEMRLFLDTEKNNLVVVNMRRGYFYLFDLNTLTQMTKLKFRLLFAFDISIALYYNEQGKQFIIFRPSNLEITTLEGN